MSYKLLCVALFVTISSCSPTRNLVYFKDLKDNPGYEEAILNKSSLKIQPDDILGITISSLNAESNALFNNGFLTTIGGAGGSGATSRSNDGYLVNKEGIINFPVLGEVKLAGLTKEEATAKLTNEIKKSIKNPVINIRILNFRVTVLGEVGNPSTYTVTGERLSLIEALALAGDLTTYGKRENILIIHEKDGVRSISRVDLSRSKTFSSQSYYLQQNDIIYVESANIKALQSGTGSFYLGLISSVIGLLSILLVFTK